MAASQIEALKLRAREHERAGDPVGAIIALKAVIKADPGQYRAWLDLARLLHLTGQFPQAVQVTQAAEQFDPLADAFGSIQHAMQSGDTDRADTIARRMLDSEPGHPRAVFTLATIAQQRGDHEARLNWLHEGLAVSPANIMLRQMAIGAHEDTGDFTGTVMAARDLVALDESLEAVWALANVTFRYGIYEESLAACARAEGMARGNHPLLAAIDTLRGHLLRILGRRDESVAAFREAVARAPSPAAWWGLADMKNYRFSPADRKAIQALLNDRAMPPAQKSLAAFALAKALEVDGELDLSMTWYGRANAWQNATAFEPERYLAAVERMVTSFSTDALQTQARTSGQGPVPIFIVGLPRSGSTLLEQILSSHSAVEGTIEHLALPSIKRRAHRHCADSLGGDYLERIGSIDEQILGEIAGRYLEQTALFRSDGRHFFTDKLPYNFEHVGLIHKILPEAVIIDARRNPMDCGLSIYKQHFAAGAEFSYRQAHIGAYYNGYLRIMDHWDRVLPGKVIRIQYETLIEDTENETRRLLDHIGLPFEAACLRFHENDRAVRTASSEQVRKPIYTSSVGSWRAVEPHLAELKSALGQVTLDRFSGLNC